MSITIPEFDAQIFNSKVHVVIFLTNNDSKYCSNTTYNAIPPTSKPVIGRDCE